MNTSLQNPNVTQRRIGEASRVALAKAYGIPATSVATGEALVEALQTSFTTPGPYLVEACF